MAASPSTANYTLGRGVLTIGEWSGTTYPTSFTDVGNVTNFEYEVTEETLEHYSSRSGLKTKDKTTTLQVEYGGSFTCDEITLANIARYIKGTSVAATSTDNAYIKGLESIDKEYALKFTSANPAGSDFIAYFWRVKLMPNGALGMISDEWGEIGYNFEGMKVDTVEDFDTEPYSSYFVIEEADTATG